MKDNRTKTFLMQRTGTFMLAVSGDHHCGTHEHHEKLKYHVTVECRQHFDARGFLFDQLQVDNYFQSIKETTLSCEQLTVKCCRELLEVIKDENDQCPVISIRLSLSPDPFAAEMTASLDREEIQEAWQS